MKAGSIIFVLAGIAVFSITGTAQERSTAGSLPAVAPQTNSSPGVLSTPSPSITTAPSFELRPAEPPAEIHAGKKWRLGGPLISIFKGGKIRQTPGRFFRAINPFHRTSEESSTTTVVEYESYQGLSPRAWATSVGWHPMRSGPPNPVTHEGGITLINVEHRENFPVPTP